MDLRQYTIVEDVVATPVAPEGVTSSKDGLKFIKIYIKESEPDVKEMVDQSAAQFQAMNAKLGLLMWGLKVFGHEEDATHNPVQWRQRLQEARTANIEHGSGENAIWTEADQGSSLLSAFVTTGRRCRTMNGVGPWVSSARR
jgi:hypothetical protein